MPDVNNLQGIVVQPCDRLFYSVLFFRIDSPEQAKTFLRRWLEMIPSGRDKLPEDKTVLHFFFSFRGIVKLLAGHALLDETSGQQAFETSFYDPTEAPDSPHMAETFGFIGDSSPRGWWEGNFVGADIDIAIYCGFFSREQQTDALDLIRQSAAQSGLVALQLNSFDQGALSGYRPPGGVLHFGFRDGITNSLVDWNDEKPEGGVNFRQFLIGYPTDDYPTSPSKPGPWFDFAKGGSYVGLTWIYQDVARFNAFLQDNEPSVKNAGVASDPKEWLAAKLLGRWRDGSPIARNPGAAPPQPDVKDDRFGYKNDPLGLKCPVTAHIRVVNPRDQPLNFANRVIFPDGPPRLLRRGFSYGLPLEGVDDDGKGRGLIGLFITSRINLGFYKILRWTQVTEFSDVYDAFPDGERCQDSMLGNRKFPRANSRAMLPISGQKPLAISLTNFIAYRGVKVFMVPSMQALTTLCGV